MVIFDENQAVSDINKYEFLNTIYVKVVNFLVIWHHFDYFLCKWVVRKPIKINEKMVCKHANFTVFGIAAFYPPLFKHNQLFLINFYAYYLQEKIYWRQSTWFWAIMHCWGNFWPFFDKIVNILPKMVKNKNWWIQHKSAFLINT